MECRSFSLLTVPKLPNFNNLYVAASEGDLSKVKALLHGGARVNIRTTNKITPLHIASQHGHLQVVKILIENAADIDFATIEGFTPLHLALQQSQLEVSEFLIKAGADVNVCDNQKWTPLHNACFNGFSAAIIKALLKRGSNIHAKNTDDDTALHIVLKSEVNHAEIVNCLIENDADLTATNKWEETPLQVAISSHSSYGGRLQVIEALLKKGADVNVPSSCPLPPLHYAAEGHDIQLSELLIKYGADVNSKNDINATPLHFAVLYEVTNLVNTLIQHGADVNAKIDKNAPHSINHLGVSWTPDPGLLLPTCFPLATPLHLAAMAGNVEITKVLLDNGAYYNARAQAGKYFLPVEFAMVKGDLKTIQLLKLVENLFNAVYYKTDVDQLSICIAEGAPVNAKDKAGGSPLYYASSDSIDGVKILLQNKADVAQTTTEGVPALYMAAYRNKVEIADALLKHAVEKLDPIKMLWFTNAIRKADLSTALHIAVENGNFFIVKLLLQYGAVYNSTINWNLAPSQIKDTIHSVTGLFKATKAGDVREVTECFQRNKFIINARDHEGGATPLYWAVHNGHTGIVKLLLENGADPNFVSYKGNTPLHIASIRGNNEAVKLLLQHLKTDNNKLKLFLNAQTTVGRTTALHVASSEDVVKSLLQYGAIYNIKNKDGKTPLDITKGNIKNLLQLTHECFERASNGNFTIIDEVKKLKDDVVTAVLNARNEQEQLTVLQVIVTNGLKYQRIAKELSEIMKKI